MKNEGALKEYNSLMKIDYGKKLICSDCSNENFASGKWILYGAVECDFCLKRTICRKIDK